jgi:hypothetical protein
VIDLRDNPEAVSALSAAADRFERGMDQIIQGAEKGLPHFRRMQLRFLGWRVRRRIRASRRFLSERSTA